MMASRHGGCGCLSAVVAFLAVVMLGTAFFRGPVQERRPGIVDVLDGRAPQETVDEAAAILEDVGCGNLEVMDAGQTMSVTAGSWSLRGMVQETQVNIDFVGERLWQVTATGVGSSETATYYDRDGARWTRHRGGRSVTLYSDGAVLGVLDATANTVASP